MLTGRLAGIWKERPAELAQSSNYSLPWPSPIFPAWTPLAYEHLEISSLGPESSPPTTPSPLFYPQLQQTETELRKVDEAIALFEKML